MRVNIHSLFIPLFYFQAAFQNVQVVKLYTHIYLGSLVQINFLDLIAH